MKYVYILKRAKENKLAFAEQCKQEIHCLAENIIDEIEGTTSHNEFQPKKPSQDYILAKAVEILDISLMKSK